VIEWITNKAASLSGPWQKTYVILITKATICDRQYVQRYFVSSMRDCRNPRMIHILGNYGRMAKNSGNIVSIYENGSIFDSNYRNVSFIKSRSASIFFIGRYIHAGVVPNQPASRDT
jgi:hypothetical protein